MTKRSIHPLLLVVLSTLLGMVLGASAIHWQLAGHVGELLAGAIGGATCGLLVCLKATPSLELRKKAMLGAWVAGIGGALAAGLVVPNSQYGVWVVVFAAACGTWAWLWMQSNLR